MNRRSFFAALLAPFMARLLPKPKPKTTGGLFNPHANLALQYEEFSRLYMRPAAIEWANQVDASVMDYYANRCSIGTGFIRFDPPIEIRALDTIPFDPDMPAGIIIQQEMTMADFLKRYPA